jgi:hypothetical protein
MTTLAISETQRHWHERRKETQPWRNMPETGDMARILAHMAVLHWTVWADLVYLEQEQEPGQQQEDYQEHEHEHEHGAVGDGFRGVSGDCSIPGQLEEREDSV